MGHSVHGVKKGQPLLREIKIQRGKAAPEPAPQCADDGLDVLRYSAPDGVLTTFDGKRTVIAIPADAPNLPRGAQAVLREIDGRPYLIFPR